MNQQTRPATADEETRPVQGLDLPRCPRVPSIDLDVTAPPPLADVRRASRPRLRAVPTPQPAPRAPRRQRTADELSVIEQIRTALLTRRHRLAAVVGLVLGGFVPLATSFIAHQVTALVSVPAVLALGGLAFSAPTVYGWARAALGSGLKAAGFVVLLEGTMCTANPLGLAWLGYAALALLVAVNATATASRLALVRLVRSTEAS